jgi:hypothetical protein
VASFFVMKKGKESRKKSRSQPKCGLVREWRTVPIPPNPARRHASGLSVISLALPAEPARFDCSMPDFTWQQRLGSKARASTSCARECNRGSLFVCQVPMSSRGRLKANTGFPQDSVRSVAKARALTRRYEGGIVFANYASSQRHSAGERCGAGLTVTSLADTSSGCPVNPGPFSCSASTAVSDPPAGASSPENRDRKRPASCACRHGSAWHPPFPASPDHTRQARSFVRGSLELMPAVA